MNLHEYQAKKLFARYGIPVPKGYACNTVLEVEQLSSKIGDGPWVVKCQIHAGGRAKSGGIKVITSKKEIRIFSEQWLGKRLVTYQTNSRGQMVNQILVEEATNIYKELYLGAVVDTSINRVVFMTSTQGGVEIEKVAKEMPHLIHKIAIDPLTGPQPYQGRELGVTLGLIGNQITQFSHIFMGLATLFLEYDLSLVEINPLVINRNGDLICLDAKLSIDGNALFRQPKLCTMRDISQEDEREAHATECNLNYISLDGNIGCMVNGAGLAMSTMDIIKFYGGKPANFLDVGGNATQERVNEAFKIILSDDKVQAVLVNIFGGIVRCDIIANGIISAIYEIGVTIPVVVRLEGNNAALGTKKLAHSGVMNIITAKSLIDAAKQVIYAVEGKSCQF